MEAADRFDSAPIEVGADAAAPFGERAIELDLCPCCDSRLVQPLDWGPTGDERWRIERRCPECDWHGEGVYAKDVVERFDDLLDEATAKLALELRMMVRANMAERVDAFIDAIHRGDILPEDF